MPQPNPSDLHVDALLTMLSIAYMNEPSAYIADQVFPVVSVAKQTDKLAKYNQDFWFRDDAALRAPGTIAPGGGYKVDTSDTYSCENYAWSHEIPDEVRGNYDSPFDPDAEGVAIVIEKLRLKREVKFATDFFKTGVWGTSTDRSSSGYQWDDYANSDPIGDTETAREGVFAATGKEINKLLLGRAAWADLKHHPDLIERIKYTQRAILTVDLVAALLEIEKIFIGKAIYASAVEGQSTQTYAYVFGKNALYLYTPAAPALRTPSAGYTFHWNKFGGISFIRRLREERPMKDIIEGHTFFDQKAVATACGYIFLNVVS